MAEKIFNTWEAVTEGVYHDPDTLVSFATYNPKTKVGIKPDMLEKLKAEACKTPIKPGNTIKFYTKEELRKGISLPDGSKLKIPSPNLFDACIVSLDKASLVHAKKERKPLSYTKNPIM